jgi:hypothetical protein
MVKNALPVPPAIRQWFQLLVAAVGGGKGGVSPREVQKFGDTVTQAVQILIYQLPVRDRYC